MTTFAGQATVAIRLAADMVTISRHAFRASVQAGGAHPSVLLAGTLVPGGNQSFDMAAGASLRVTSAFQSNAAAITPNAGDLLGVVELCNEAGTLIRSVTTINVAGGFTLGSLIAGTDVTFYATSDGTATGTPLAGTYQLAVSLAYATRTADPVNGAYTVDTLTTDARSGTPNTWQVAPAMNRDKGYLRASTTVELTVSGSGVRAYGQVLTLTNTLANALLQAYAVTLALGPSSGTTNSATNNQTRTVTVNNVFPVAASVYTIALTIPNSTLSGIAEFVITGTTARTVTVDPRLTIQLYMQLNTTALNTPPDGITDVNHNVVAKLASDVGLVAIRVKDALGAGVNGITFTTGSITADDVNALTAPIVRAGNNFSTNTLNGADGWVTASAGLGGANPNFLSWAASQPGGTWNFAYTISGPAGATGLETPVSPQTLIMLAQNPNIRVVIDAGPAATNEQDHFSPGDVFNAGFTMNNLLQHSFSLPGNPQLGLRRFNQTLARWEYLRTTDLTWQPTGSGTLTNSVFTTSTTPALTVSSDGVGYDFSLTGAQTAAWGYTDVVIVAIGSDANGTPYSATYVVIVTGSNNEHDGYSFDAIGYGLSGKVSFK